MKSLVNLIYGKVSCGSGSSFVLYSKPIQFLSSAHTMSHGTPVATFVTYKESVLLQKRRGENLQVVLTSSAFFEDKRARSSLFKAAIEGKKVYPAEVLKTPVRSCFAQWSGFLKTLSTHCICFWTVCFNMKRESLVSTKVYKTLMQDIALIIYLKFWIRKKPGINKTDQILECMFLRWHPPNRKPKVFFQLYTSGVHMLSPEGGTREGKKKGGSRGWNNKNPTLPVLPWEIYCCINCFTLSDCCPAPLTSAHMMAHRTSVGKVFKDFLVLHLETLI